MENQNQLCYRWMQEQIKEEYIAKIFVCVVSVNFVHKKMAEIVKKKKFFCTGPVWEHWEAFVQQRISFNWDK